MLHKSLFHHSKSFPHLTDGEILLNKDKMVFMSYSTWAADMTEEYWFSVLYYYTLCSVLCFLLSNRTSCDF